ncbi:MAG: hypothetical protein NTX86_01640 [Candidatus Dependentiae bacterium]|nr:hypothetical protein [Candidatus Dependentiae bacterium]
MNYKRFLSVLLIFLSLVINAQEYLYPVASITRGATPYLYFIHQKSLHNLELLQWDPETKVLSKALSSLPVIAGLRVLPDNSGFSFFDKAGHINVKFFNKRSPKVLEIYEPMHGIEMLEWIDAQHFYCYAHCNPHGYDTIAVFEGDVNGYCRKIAGGLGYDCLYPQKIGSKLFYIERWKEEGGGYSYYLMSMDYPEISRNCTSFNTTNNFDERVAAFIKNKEQGIIGTSIASGESQQLIACGSQPCRFLHMVSHREGFFVRHTETVDTLAHSMLFSYHHIQQNVDETWSMAQLFAFDIPMGLITGENDERLYESLLPLLPFHVGLDIYYTTLQVRAKMALPSGRTARGLGIFRYNLENKTTIPVSTINSTVNFPEELKKNVSTLAVLPEGSEFLTSELEGSCFAPFAFANKIFYGKVLQSSKEANDLLSGMSLNEYGDITYQAPYSKD